MLPRTRIALLAATVLVVAAAAAVVVLAAGLSGTGSSPTSSDMATTPGFEGAALPPGVRAHAFTLTALSSPPGAGPGGGMVSLGQFEGRVVVLAFLYPGCGRTCTLIADQIRGALDELRERPAVVIVDASQTIGEDVRVRARARVQRFLEETSLAGSVYFLTGPPARLRAVWRAYGVVPAEAGRSRFGEYAQVLLIDGKGAERVLFGMEDLTAEGLAHDVRKLQSG